jgi:putative flippase GtrA
MTAAALVVTRERDRFLRFAVVGIIGAVVDFGIFNLLSSLFRVKPVWASVLSFTAAVCSNFILNRYWTYPDSRSKRMSQQIVQFTIISMIGLAIRTPIFVKLEGPLIDFFGYLHLPLASLSPTFLGHNLALAIAVLVVMFWNFFINRYWTYSDVT